MLVEKIKPREAAGEVNVIIEIPMNDNPVKYELDKDTGAIWVDRFMQVAMSYPCNYGFVPSTLSGDGDPIDVMVVSNYPIVPGAVIRARPIGVLLMEDESGIDEKVIAVPISKVDISFENVKSLDDLNPLLKQRIVHFFEHYKDLEKGKWVKVQGFEGPEKAESLILEALDRAKTSLK